MADNHDNGTGEVRVPSWVPEGKRGAYRDNAKKSQGARNGKSVRKKKRKAPLPIRILKGIRNVFLILLLLIICTAAGLMIHYYPKYKGYKESAYRILTDIDESSFVHAGNTLVYDKDGNLIGKLGNENYEYLDVADIPAIIKDGYVAVEDKDFAVHNGVDVKALSRAAYQLVKNKGKITQGGSTITMQVVKNSLLTQEKSFDRKFLEILLALEIEKRFDKGKIMEIYCNTNYYGENCYGVSAAAKYYFGKDVRGLTVGESAMLIGMSNNPGHYNPVSDYDMSLTKRDQVLGILKDAGVITEEDYKEGTAEKPEIIAKGTKASADSYMLNYAVHCTVLEEMKRAGFRFKYSFDSEEDYQNYKSSYDNEYAGYLKMVRGGGYVIYTSLDGDKQALLQQSVSDGLSGFTEQAEDGTYAMQGAAVSIDNSTGLVVAIVGGREPDGKLNRAYLSSRQPGSSIKLLLDYGPAINEGLYSPGSIVTDQEVTISGYSPKNAGGGYHGALPLREALARSLNTVAFQLFEETGSSTCLSYLQKMKFSTLTFSDQNNAAVSIGGFTEGVTLTDMARGYAAIENGGKMRTSDCLVKVTDTDGKVLYQYDKDDAGKKVFTPDTAFMLCDMLQGGIREEYGTAHRAAAALSEQYYAGKTGTTNNSKDLWFCGFTPYYTTVVWAGYDTPKAIPGASGSHYPLSIFTDYMTKVHEGLPKKGYSAPPTVKLSNSTEQQDVVYDNDDEYGSRPAGWDYVSTQNIKKVEDNAAARAEAAAEAAAEKAVTNYEDYVVASVDAARSIDTDYYAVLEAIDDVADQDKAASFRERAGAKHDMLMDTVQEAWLDKIKADDEAKASEAKQKAAEMSQEAAESASESARNTRISSYRAILEDVNAALIYTDSLEEMLKDAEDMLSRCTFYPEYGTLEIELEEAKAYVDTLKAAAQPIQNSGSGSVP